MPSNPGTPDDVSRPRQERAQATYAAIVQAAAIVFAERGYARTSLDTVAVEAGVTKGALYFHFASKNDLANAVIREETRVITEGADRIIAEGRAAIETIVLLVQAFTERLADDVVIAAGVKLSTEEVVAQLDIDEPFAVWAALYDRLFTRAIAEGDVLSTLDPAVLARYLLGLVTGVQLVSSSLTGRADLRDRVSEMWQILLPSIVTPGRLDGLRVVPALEG